MTLRSPHGLSGPRASHAAPLIERLETRRLLAINPVGVQPTGPLSGKIVYTSAGHGWQWNSTLGRYATDRGDNNELVEDFGNQEQMSFFADYVLRAGGTLVPMRPVGRQTNEVVLDNDSSAVTYTGSWSNSTGTRYYDEDYGATADAVSYRFANTNSAGETATATYTPNIPQAGFYPVYTWVAHGTNRTSQLYKINHSGGQFQIRVDHSKVGNGWVYLGTYHFNAGSSAAGGSVQISNLAADGKVVIADAIRFGNGMGDARLGSAPRVSGYPREDENALHWIYRGIGMGGPASVINVGNVSAPSDMAEEMNADTNAFGTSVYIGFHSNAGGGRGAVGLIDTDLADRTPHQADLALYTGRQINQDMQALNGQFEHNWSTRTTHTYTGQFGEINLGTGAEMDATIIEVAFHDSVEDAQLMRDPKVRDQLARSTYEATLEYFDNWGGLTSPVATPSAPINVRALSNASGQVTLNWNAGPTGVRGGAATGFRIYTSLNGYGFDGGTFVPGGNSVTAHLGGFDPNVPHYFKIVAVNAGGESLASEVAAALPSGGAKNVLIVSGFDRFDRGGNVRYPYAHTSDGLVDRVFPRLNNSFDYTVQVAAAIHASKPGTHVASTSNEAIINGAVDLTQYDSVVWILGEESTVNKTFDATEQSKVEQFIAGGGNLFVTGAEIGWDLDQQNNGRAFYETTLKGNYVSDDAGTYAVSGVAGSIFAGLSFSFDNGSQFYDVDYPDVIAPQAGATAALNYSGGTGGGAAIQVPGTDGRGSVVMFGFPFETITTAGNRAAVMGRVLDFFTPTTGTIAGRLYYDYNDNGVQDPGEGGMAGVSVRLDTDNSGVLTAADMSVVTNAAGDYFFPAAPAGTFLLGTGSLGNVYHVGAVTRTVTIVPDARITGQDFQFFPLNINGTGGNDRFYIRLDPTGTSVQISAGDAPLATPTYSVNRNDIYELRFNLAGGDDALTVDHTFGRPTLGNLHFDGGANATAEGDLLRVIGNDAGTLITVSASGVSLLGGSTLFPSVERIVVDALGGNDTLNFNGVTGVGTVTAHVTFNGGAGDNQLNVNGGTYTLDADAAAGNENLAVSVLGTLRVNASQHLSSLHVGAGGVVTFAPHGSRVLSTRALTLSSTARLDLADNDLVLDYEPSSPSPLADIEDLLIAGRNGGAWDGYGIVTSMSDAVSGLTTLGIANSAAALSLEGNATGAFGSETVDASAVLIKYTYAGDANLDGAITGDDYSNIDFGILFPGMSGYWNGDFNYDGVITGDDYSVIDLNILLQGARL